MLRSLLRRLGVLLLWSVCTLSPAWAAPAPEPAVLLLSFDGTHPEQIRVAGLPGFARLLREGASARRLEPVFPTNTFPNHVTLVTGVAPERHGVVNNVFLDPRRGLFRYEDDPSWIEVPPLWSLLAASGVRSASFHWVGSEGAWRDGGGPGDWRPFDRDLPADRKIDQILAWLDRPAGTDRPRFISAWFPGADRAGHREGPDSAAVRRDLAALDRSLGRLLAGLDARALLPSTTLLVVSDHGMARVERRVDLQAALDGAGLAAHVLGGGGFASVHVEPGTRGEAVVRQARALGLEAWLRGQAPPSLRVSNPRFGDVVVLAPVGTALARARSGSGGHARPKGGAHGYPAEEPSMAAILLALGRGARAGTDLGVQRALDVAPTVLALLGVPQPDWVEGRPIRSLLPQPAGAERSGS